MLQIISSSLIQKKDCMSVEMTSVKFTYISTVCCPLRFISVKIIMAICHLHCFLMVHSVVNTRAICVHRKTDKPPHCNVEPEKEKPCPNSSVK